MREEATIGQAEIFERLRRLERQNRTMKRIGLLLLFSAGAVFWMAQVRVARTVEARRVVLRDAKGRKRAELALALDKPALTFFDDAEKTTVSLGADEEGTGLVIFGPANQRAVALNVTEGGPILSMYARSGARRLNISVTGQGPTIGLLSPNGDAKAAFGVAGADNAFLHLFGVREHGGTQLSAGSDRAVLRFFDSADKPRAVLGILEKENTPGLTLNDPGGVARAMLMLTPGGAALDFLDANKNVAWRAP